MIPSPWTPAIDEALRASYSAGGIHAARAALPGFTEPAIYKRARRLGLSRRRRWTRDDVVRLRSQWDIEPIAAIARGLGRTRITVYQKARELGLSCGAPEGWEYVSVAAARCGYSAGQLRRILRFAGVRVLPSQSRGLPGAGHRYHIVERGEAEEAVARWHETETVEAAARRHGVDGETMTRWLAAAGVSSLRVAPSARSRTRAGKFHRRVASADVDRAVAAWLARGESLSAAAGRIGVTRQTLAAWLRSAGVGGGGYHWTLAAGVADRVAAQHGRRTP